MGIRNLHRYIVRGASISCILTVLVGVQTAFGSGWNAVEVFHQSNPSRGEFAIQIGDIASSGWIQGIESSERQMNVGVLPQCASPTQSDCISEVDTRIDNLDTWNSAVASMNQIPADMTGNLITNSVTGSVAKFSSFKFNESTKIYSGGTASIWEAKDPHEGGNEYLISAFVKPPEDPQPFGISVVPIKWLGYTNSNFGSEALRKSNRYEFPTGFNVRIVVKVNQIRTSLNGWFTGISKNVQVEDLGDRIVISSSPLTTPIARTTNLKCSEHQTAISDLGISEWNQRTCVDYGGLTRVYTSDEYGALRAFRDWEPHLKQVGVTSGLTLRLNSYTPINNCKTEGLSGFVFSNSLAYENAPPKWNPVTESLEYRVASTHTDHKGEQNSGYYELSLKESFAKCLWGGDISKAKATISIEYSNGDSAVVQSATFQTTGGYTKFMVAGFHFSSPTISIKLIQEPTVNVASNPAPTPIAMKPKKFLTYCTKGKMKILMKPKQTKCPKGFLKKNISSN